MARKVKTINEIYHELLKEEQRLLLIHLEHYRNIALNLYEWENLPEGMEGRHIEQALGDGVKKVSDSEKANISVARKSIVAACPIKKGELLTEENLTVKRPGTGLSPMLWDKVIGTIAIKDYEEEDLIQL